MRIDPHVFDFIAEAKIEKNIHHTNIPCAFALKDELSNTNVILLKQHRNGDPRNGAFVFTT